MLPLTSHLDLHISKAIQTLFGLENQKIELQPTRKEFKGSHTLVTFGLAKQTCQSPDQTALKIGEYLKNENLIQDFEVVKGFLNLTLPNNIWQGAFLEALQNLNFGNNPKKNEKILVEYCSPNTNKPIHLGHLRNIFLGWSLCQILDADGYDVTKCILVNDRGIHICKSMLAYQKYGNDETPQSSKLKGDHLIGKYYVMFSNLHKDYLKKQVEEGKLSQEDAEKPNATSPILQEAQIMLQKWEQGDKETLALWQKMNDWVLDGFKETYKNIGVGFDKWYFESNTYILGKEIVEEGVKNGIFYKKDDNSVWIDLTSEKLDHKLVQRGDGTSVYITQDMGTADLKYQDFQMKKSVYVVGNEQDYHFKVLFAIFKKFNRAYAEGSYHLSYGMVELPSGKMKSREGKVVDADDMVAEMINIAKEKTAESGKLENLKKLGETELNHIDNMIGLGAIKYFLLKVDAKKTMLFNPEESLEFDGDASPYIQYNHARIKTILRRAESENIGFEVKDFQNYLDWHNTEHELLQLLLQFPNVIAEASKTYSPYIVAQFCYEIAKMYSKFFFDCSIFKAHNEEARAFRLALSALTGNILKKAMLLLGIDVPEMM